MTFLPNRPDGLPEFRTGRFLWSWRGAAAHEVGEPQHKLSLDGRLDIVIGRNGRFEGHIVLGILECADYGFGPKTMADGIAAGSLLAFFRRRSGALGRIAPVGCGLPE
jgi:hypothetical protein